MPTQILTANKPQRSAAMIRPIALGLACVAIWLGTIALVTRLPEALPNLLGP